MIWDYFIYFALVAALLWIAGAYLAWRNRLTQSVIATSIGLVVFFAYILIMWITLERPPMRTMGETRLWYSFFLPLIGIFIYSRCKYHWILSFSTILALVFIGVNLFKPEIHTKAMMPALQSPGLHLMSLCICLLMRSLEHLLLWHFTFFSKRIDIIKRCKALVVLMQKQPL